MDDSHPEGKISLQLQLYLEIPTQYLVGGPRSDIDVQMCPLLRIQQLHTLCICALYAMLTFKSV